MAKRNGSLIPQKLQIPVIIVGACVLVVVVLWRVQQIRASRAGISGQQAAQQEQPMSEPGDILLEWREVLGDLSAARAELTRIREHQAIRSADFEPMERDPFHLQSTPVKTVEASQKTSVTEVVGTPLAQPAEKNAGMKLAATCVNRNRPNAIINGNVYEPGDNVAGYQIEKIGVRHVVLSDNTGEWVLWMEGVPGL